MRTLIEILLTVAFFLAVIAAGAGDHFDAMLGTEFEVPNPWGSELKLLSAAGALVLLSAGLMWIWDRAKYYKGERTFFPHSWLFVRK